MEFAPTASDLRDMGYNDSEIEMMGHGMGAGFLRRMARKTRKAVAPVVRPLTHVALQTASKIPFVGAPAVQAVRSTASEAGKIISRQTTEAARKIAAIVQRQKEKAVLGPEKEMKISPVVWGGAALVAALGAAALMAGRRKKAA